MTTRPAILALLLALRPHAEDAAEPWNARAVRLDAAAVGIARAGRIVEWPGPPLELSAALVGLGYEESGFAERIHRGDCRLSLGECDAYRTPWGELRARALSPWQVQGQRAAIVVGTGYRPTAAAALAAARVLERGAARCGGTTDRERLERAIAAYATGYRCHWRRAAARADRIDRLRARLERLAELNP